MPLPNCCDFLFTIIKAWPLNAETSCIKLDKSYGILTVNMKEVQLV